MHNNHPKWWARLCRSTFLSSRWTSDFFKKLKMVAQIEAPAACLDYDFALDIRDNKCQRCKGEWFTWATSLDRWTLSHFRRLRQASERTNPIQRARNWGIRLGEKPGTDSTFRKEMILYQAIKADRVPCSWHICWAIAAIAVAISGRRRWCLFNWTSKLSAELLGRVWWFSLRIVILFWFLQYERIGTTLPLDDGF